MRNSIIGKVKSAGYAVAAAVTTALPFMPMASASGSTAAAKTIIQGFLGYVVDMFICVGVLLGVWAIAQLALSFKNEDADSKSRAMMMLIVAAMLIGIQALAQLVLSGTGLSIGSGFLALLPGLM